MNWFREDGWIGLFLLGGWGGALPLDEAVAEQEDGGLPYMKFPISSRTSPKNVVGRLSDFGSAVSLGCPSFLHDRAGEAFGPRSIDTAEIFCRMLCPYDM
jgi:hypothetical protein